jgi:hypothetical protein
LYQNSTETMFDIGECFWGQVNSVPVSAPGASASLIAGMQMIFVAAVTSMSADDAVPIGAPTVSVRVLCLIRPYSQQHILYVHSSMRLSVRSHLTPIFAL